MRLNLRMWLLVLATVFMTGTAAAQDIKIGVVNLGKLVRASPQAQQARENLEAQFADRKKALQELAQELQADIKRLKRDGKVMSKQAREQLAESIRDQQRRLEIKRSNYKADLRRAEQEQLAQIRKALAQAIQQYAEDFNYDLIIGQGVLYATDAVNITERLLQRLEAQAQS